jgi:hypothetical protein
MSDIQQQLGAILGREVKQVRKTGEIPPRVSVIDVAVVITAHGAKYASEAVRNIFQTHPDVSEKIGHVKFPDSRGRKGQKSTPVIDVRGAVELVLLLPGRQAARVRRQAAELLVRYLGGDASIVDEVCQIRAHQEELAVRAPEDPRRIFGEAVEAASGSAGPPGHQIAQLHALLQQKFTQIDERFAAYTKTHSEALQRIQERLEQDRQRVNLNVRAPNRSSPQNPPIARDIEGADMILCVLRPGYSKSLGGCGFRRPYFVHLHVKTRVI